MLFILLVVFATAVVDTNGSFHMFIKNPSGSDVQLVWISPEGAEQPIDNIAAAGEIRVNTFHGHTFGWRAVGTSDVLREFVTKSEMADTYYTLPGMTAHSASEHCEAGTDTCNPRAPVWTTNKFLAALAKEGPTADIVAAVERGGVDAKATLQGSSIFYHVIEIWSSKGTFNDTQQQQWGRLTDALIASGADPNDQTVLLAPGLYCIGAS